MDSEAELSTGQLRAAVEAIPWFHHIDLGHGIVTPGQDAADPAWKLRFMQLPEDLSGKSVLDIGAWDGFFSFEADRRGASPVLAVDSYSWSGEGWGSKAGFNLARKVLHSQVEDRHLEVLELSPESVGLFDLVLFLGVLYHLRHPLLALEKVASVTKEMLIVSTQVDLLGLPRPAMAFYPTTELNNDSTNWWAPNVACLEAMLKDVGFRRVDCVTPIEPTPLDGTIQARAATLHAWK